MTKAAPFCFRSLLQEQAVDNFERREDMYKKKGRTVPKRVKAINPMLILVAFLVIAAIATYLVPAGSF